VVDILWIKEVFFVFFAHFSDKNLHLKLSEDRMIFSFSSFVRKFWMLTVKLIILMLILVQDPISAKLFYFFGEKIPVLSL
jgi:hypothetical protein